MIPADHLQHIRRVEIRSWRLAEEYLVGAYRSVFKGRGIDFEGVREYSAGDDVRFIDWNVTARTGSTYIREFREERELSVVLAVDVSASGEFASGGQSKHELAAEVAACLAFSAVSNGDKVGLLLFTNQVEGYLPPRKGRRQALKIIRAMLDCAPQRRGTSLQQGLNFLNHVQRRRAIVFVLSDFLDRGFEQSVKVTSRRHDLIPIVIRDARERTLPDVGWLIVEDAESGELAEVNTSDRRVRERFALLGEKRQQALRQDFRRMGTDTIELETGESYLKPIRQFMDKRLSQRLR